MKIRNGFVSNSSSSSFVITARRINIKDVTDEMLKKRDTTEYFIIGKSLSEGEDLIDLSYDGMLDICKKLFSGIDRHPCVEVTDRAYTDEYIEESFDIDELSYEFFKEFNFVKNQHSTCDVIDLMGRYKEYIRRYKVDQL